jgi:hypothetical protein
MTLTLLLLFLFVGIPLLVGFCMNPVPEFPDYQERDLKGLDGRDLWKELEIPNYVCERPRLHLVLLHN